MSKTNKVFLIIGTLLLLQKTDPATASITNPCQDKTCSTGQKCCTCDDPINMPPFYPLCIDESESCSSKQNCWDTLVRNDEPAERVQSLGEHR
jgi:hypothetical protein